jgi:putative RecB family exonuclease
MKKSLEELRSTKHVSASALKSFLICPKKFEFQYVLGAQPEFRPSAMLLGRAVHEALAVHHRALKDDRTMPAQTIVERFQAAIDLEAQHPVPVQWKDGENLDSFRLVGAGLVEVYLQEAKLQRILAVEEPFQAELVDPRTGELLEPKLVGFFDLIEADDDGTVSVVEIKTAAKRWSAAQVETDVQTGLYCEALVQADLVPEGDAALVRFDILVKNKKPVLDRQYAVRRPRDRETARMIAIDAVKAIESGSSFYRNPGWQCDGCPFRKQCGI